MVKRFLILTVALVLQSKSVIHAAEPDSGRFFFFSDACKIEHQKLTQLSSFLTSCTVTRDTDAILAKLKIDLEPARNRAGIPGMSVAVIHKGKLVFAEGYGKRNQKDPFTPEVRDNKKPVKILAVNDSLCPTNLFYFHHFRLGPFLGL